MTKQSVKHESTEPKAKTYKANELNYGEAYVIVKASSETSWSEGEIVIALHEMIHNFNDRSYLRISNHHGTTFRKLYPGERFVLTFEGE